MGQAFTKFIILTQGNMQKYKKKDIGSIVEADKEGSIWYLKHVDGCTTRLSDSKFKLRYEKVEENES